MRSRRRRSLSRDAKSLVAVASRQFQRRPTNVTMACGGTLYENAPSITGTGRCAFSVESIAVSHGVTDPHIAPPTSNRRSTDAVGSPFTTTIAALLRSSS